MATRKVTVTLEEDQVEAIRALVAGGTAPSVSGFVQHAVRISLSDAAEWKNTLAELLEQTGGPMTPEEREWADEMLGASPPKSERQRRPPTA